MKRRTRRILLFLATAVFVVVTPLIILYALGFRLTSQRVGVLLLDSLPSRAQVFVDEELIGTTPKTISGLGGTSVTISVQKEGYTSWEKRLPFATGITSEVQAILLLPKSVTPHVFAPNVSQFSLAPNRNLIAAVDSTGLTIYDENQRVIVPRHVLPSSPSALLWSPDSTFIVISYNASRRDVLSLQDGTLRPLPTTALAGADAMAWDPRLPGRLLLLSAERELFAFTISEQVRQPIAIDVIAFAPSARDIVVATSRNLTRVSLQGLQSEAALALEKPIRKVVVSPAGHVVVWFQDGRVSLWEGTSLVDVASSAQTLGFSPSGELLYVQTAPHELVVMNIGDERLMHIPLRRPYLVTRVSHPITQPQWFAGGQHLVYQIGDQIIFTEIDTRDHAVSAVIDSTNLTDAGVAVGENGEALFYLKRDDFGTTSLVRTDLIIP